MRTAFTIPSARGQVSRFQKIAITPTDSMLTYAQVIEDHHALVVYFFAVLSQSRSDASSGRAALWLDRQ